MTNHLDDPTAAAIRSADRPRPASEVERRRMRIALEEAIDRGVPTPVLRVVPPPSHARGRPFGLAAAFVAVASVVSVLGVLAWSRMPPAEPDPPAVSIPSLVTPTAVRRVCANEVAALDIAVGSWGEVDDWAASMSGTPDLATLTSATLDALALVGLDSAAARDELDAVVAERASYELPPPGSALEAHAAAVRRGLVVIVEALAALDPQGICPTAAIRNALSR